MTISSLTSSLTSAFYILSEAVNDCLRDRFCSSKKSVIIDASTNLIDRNSPTPRLPDWNAIEGCQRIRSSTLKNGATVNIFRYKDDFIIESIFDKKIHQITADFDMPPDEFEKKAKKHFICIDKRGKVDFMWSAKSQVNKDKKNVIIDGDNWGMTIVNTGLSRCSIKDDNDFYNSLSTWTGHIALFIETVDEDGYHMWRGDALRGAVWKEKKNWYDKATVYLLKVRWDEFHPDENGQYLSEKYPRTQTWVKAKNLVQKMMAQISKEAQLSLRKEPIGFRNSKPIIFCEPGGTSDQDSDHLYNCSKWTRERIFLADIYVKPAMYFFPGDYPISYTNSTLSQVSLEASGFAVIALVSGIIGGLPFALLTCSGFGASSGMMSLIGRYSQRQQFQRFKDEVEKEKL